MIREGDVIRIVRMEGETGYTWRTGTVQLIDSLGQLHGTWGGLAVQPDRDIIQVISSVGGNKSNDGNVTQA